MKKLVPFIALICCSVLLCAFCQGRKAEIVSESVTDTQSIDSANIVSEDTGVNEASEETASPEIQETNESQTSSVLSTAKTDEVCDKALLLFPGQIDYTKSTKVAIDRDKYGFNFYIFGFDGIDMLYKGKRESLKDLVESGRLTPTEIIDRCKIDKKNERLELAAVCKDGGTLIYEYENYSIIKYRSIDGDRDLVVAPHRAMGIDKYNAFYSIVKHGLEWSKYCNEPPLKKTINGKEYTFELYDAYMDENSRVIKKYRDGDNYIYLDEISGTLLYMSLDDVSSNSNYIPDHSELEESAKRFIIENCDPGNIELEKIDYHEKGYSVHFIKTVDGEATGDWIIVCLTNNGDIYTLNSSRIVFDRYNNYKSY